MQNPYKSFNVLLRRRPEANNFKAVLETIRGLMNTKSIVPQWLHEVLLGYGEPDSAAWYRMPAANRAASLDFTDTFLDWPHVVESFPNSSVVAAADEKAAEGDAPPPPYRLHLPTPPPTGSEPETDVEALSGELRVETFRVEPSSPFTNCNPQRFVHAFLYVMSHVFCGLEKNSFI